MEKVRINGIEIEAEPATIMKLLGMGRIEERIEKKTSKRIPREEWSEAEKRTLADAVNKLPAMKSKRKSFWKKLAKKLGRTRQAVKWQLRQMGIKLNRAKRAKKKAEKSHQPYSEKERLLIMTLRGQGKTIGEIARIMGRSRAAIANLLCMIKKRTA